MVRQMRQAAKIVHLQEGEVENGNSKLTDFRCPRCKDPQARTDGVDVYFGVRKVPGNPIRLEWLCTKCKAQCKWRNTTGRKSLLDASISATF